MTDLALYLDPYMDVEIRALAANLPPKRQQSLLVGRSLLKFVLVANGLVQESQTLPQIAYTSLHKPFFVDLPLKFNLSHSHGWIALTVGSRHQGLDLEQIDTSRKIKEALLKRVLHSSELEFLRNVQFKESKLRAEPSELREDIASSKVDRTGKAIEEKLSLSELLPLSGAGYEFFFLQWTLKECLLKLQGSSIFALDRLVFEPQQQLVRVLNSDRALDSELSWFDELLSFKLGSLYALMGGHAELQQDFWLTVGTYNQFKPQIRILANQNPHNVSSACTKFKQQNHNVVTSFNQGKTVYKQDLYDVFALSDQTKIDHLNLAKKNRNLPPFSIEGDFWGYSTLDQNDFSSEIIKGSRELSGLNSGVKCLLNLPNHCALSWYLLNCKPDVVYAVSRCN